MWHNEVYQQRSMSGVIRDIARMDERYGIPKHTLTTPAISHALLEVHSTVLLTLKPPSYSVLSMDSVSKSCALAHNLSIIDHRSFLR